MIVATVAYSVWALALPDTPFAARSWYSAPLAGFAVVFVTVVLGLLEPLVPARLKGG